mmetsp:Transcript_912/g.2035  ORF Transcript_912/g.2035 Transcript_912/m.2035 type:complete len:488 (+) Transcript_912:390-1853(+)
MSTLSHSPATSLLSSVDGRKYVSTALADNPPPLVLVAKRDTHIRMWVECTWHHVMCYRQPKPSLEPPRATSLSSSRLASPRPSRSLCIHHILTMKNGPTCSRPSVRPSVHLLHQAGIHLPRLDRYAITVHTAVDYGRHERRQHHQLQRQPLPQRHQPPVLQRRAQKDYRVGQRHPEGRVVQQRRLAGEALQHRVEPPPPSNANVPEDGQVQEVGVAGHPVVQDDVVAHLVVGQGRLAVTAAPGPFGVQPVNGALEGLLGCPNAVDDGGQEGGGDGGRGGLEDGGVVARHPQGLPRGEQGHARAETLEAVSLCVVAVAEFGHGNAGKAVQDRHHQERHGSAVSPPRQQRRGHLEGALHTQHRPRQLPPEPERAQTHEQHPRHGMQVQPVHRRPHALAALPPVRGGEDLGRIHARDPPHITRTPDTRIHIRTARHDLVPLLLHHLWVDRHTERRPDEGRGRHDCGLPLGEDGRGLDRRLRGGLHAQAEL